MKSNDSNILIKNQSNIINLQGTSRDLKGSRVSRSQNRTRY